MIIYRFESPRVYRNGGCTSKLRISFDSSLSFEVFPRPHLLLVVTNDNVDGVDDSRRLSGGGMLILSSN